MNADQRTKAIQILQQQFGPQWKSVVQSIGTEDLRRRVG